MYTVYFARLINHDHLHKCGSAAMIASSVMILDKPCKPSATSYHATGKGHDRILQPHGKAAILKRRRSTRDQWVKVPPYTTIFSYLSHKSVYSYHDIS